MKRTLHSVIDSLIDSQKEFQKIGEELKTPTLKLSILMRVCSARSFAASETILHQEGVARHEEGGSVSATVQRVWGELKAKLGGGDQTLLETAEKAEVKSVAAYGKGLEQMLPFPVRQLLGSQSAHVQLFHDYIKAARKLGM